MTGGIREWSVSPAGDRILLRSADTLGLCDARTGMPLARLGERPRPGDVPGATAGSPWWRPSPASGPELRIFPADGRSEPRRFPFPGARSLIVADQPAPGLLRVVTSRARRAGLRPRALGGGPGARDRPAGEALGGSRS